MSITGNLEPDAELGLIAQAQAKGISLTDHAWEILTREAKPITRPSRTGQALVDACAKIRGLLTDDEIDIMFARNRSIGRPVAL